MIWEAGGGGGVVTVKASVSEVLVFGVPAWSAKLPASKVTSTLPSTKSPLNP